MWSEYYPPPLVMVPYDSFYTTSSKASYLMLLETKGHFIPKSYFYYSPL